MCKAIDDMKNDAKNEGIRIGYKSGMLVTLHNLYNEELLSLEKAAEKASMTVDEFLMATKEFAK